MWGLLTQVSCNSLSEEAGGYVASRGGAKYLYGKLAWSSEAQTKLYLAGLLHGRKMPCGSPVEALLASVLAIRRSEERGKKKG